MSESRKKILNMLAEKKITVEEAALLLEKLSGSEEPAPAEQSAPQPSKAPRFLRIVVDSQDGDKVNVKVPLSLIRTGIKLGSLMPREAAETVSETGLDLSALGQLDEDELAKALSELTVDVDSADGDKVRVFAE